MREEAVILSSGVCMFINWSLASLEWTLVLYLYIILGPLLSGPGFFHLILAVSSYFWAFPEASVCLTNPYFEINNLKSMIWNPSLLMITNAYQPHFEISDLELLITDNY